MKPEEKQVFDDFAKYANVVEPWAIYDTIVICQTLYGTEQQVSWFTTWAAFAGRETHTFFKTRTEGNVGLPYCNLQSADSMDFAFICHSIGVAVMAPVPNPDVETESIDGQDIGSPEVLLGHWFASDFPRHSGIQFKVQQDIRAEANVMMMPPGYGPYGSGTAFQATAAAVPAHGDIPFMSNAVCQGVPVLANRYPLPVPIGIPRTGSIEGILHVSEFARDVLGAVVGPRNLVFNSDDGTPSYNFFPSRYMIQMSLIGERLVQQRGQYHR